MKQQTYIVFANCCSNIHQYKNMQSTDNFGLRISNFCSLTLSLPVHIMYTSKMDLCSIQWRHCTSCILIDTQFTLNNSKQNTERLLSGGSALQTVSKLTLRRTVTYKYIHGSALEKNRIRLVDCLKSVLLSCHCACDSLHKYIT